MLYAQNDIGISRDVYTPANTFRLDRSDAAEKLDIHVVSENEAGELVYGPVFIDTTEDENYEFPEDKSREQKLETGLHSKPYSVPITAFRVRILTGYEAVNPLPALIHYTFYGIG